MSDQFAERQVEHLCERHALDDPEEFDRVVAAHPSELVVDEQRRLLGLLPLVTRGAPNLSLPLRVAGSEGECA